MSDAWLLHPCPGWPVSQHYGERKAQYAKFGLPDGHEGIDYACPVGTLVVAAADGEIVTLQRDLKTKHPYGVFLRIQHAHEWMYWITVYAHLDSIAPELWAGSRVIRGQVIGYSGSTGNSTGPHLHFSVRRNGIIVDPEPYIIGGAA